MIWQTLTDSWWLMLFVAAVLYAVVASTLNTLSAQYHAEVDVHDRIHQSHALRQAYTEALKARRDAH